MMLTFFSRILSSKYETNLLKTSIFSVEITEVLSWNCNLKKKKNHSQSCVKNGFIATMALIWCYLTPYSWPHEPPHQHKETNNLFNEIKKGRRKKLCEHNKQAIMMCFYTRQKKFQLLVVIKSSSNVLPKSEESRDTPYATTLNFILIGRWLGKNNQTEIDVANLIQREMLLQI